MMSNHKIPISPSELPQQKVYEVVPLPDKPLNFEAYCTLGANEQKYNWLLDTEDMPKRFPSSATFMASVEWAWDYYHNRNDGYYLSSNTKKTHWFLWIKSLDDNSFDWKYHYCIYAYCPRVSNEPHSMAVHLLTHAWNTQATAESIDEPHMIMDCGLISLPELKAISRGIWPSE